MPRMSKTESELQTKRLSKTHYKKGDKRASEGGSKSGQKNFLPLFDLIQGSEGWKTYDILT